MDDNESRKARIIELITRNTRPTPRADQSGTATRPPRAGDLVGDGNTVVLANKIVHKTVVRLNRSQVAKLGEITIAATDQKKHQISR